MEQTESTEHALSEHNQRTVNQLIGLLTDTCDFSQEVREHFNTCFSNVIRAQYENVQSKLSIKLKTPKQAGEKAVKVKKDRSAVIAKKTGYQFFISCTIREGNAAAVAAGVEPGQGPKSTDKMSEAARQWKDLDADGRSIYDRTATVYNECMARLKEARPNWTTEEGAKKEMQAEAEAFACGQTGLVQHSDVGSSVSTSGSSTVSAPVQAPVVVAPVVVATPVQAPVVVAPTPVSAPVTAPVTAPTSVKRKNRNTAVTATA